VVERIAASKHEQGQLFDITEVAIEDGSNNADATAEVSGRLEEAANLDKVQVTATRIQEDGALERILEASTNYDLIAIGARPPRAASTLTLGELQDQLIDNAQADVLIAINHDSDNFDCHSVNRILVPTNGLEYSMDAGDIAGALAEACNAQMSIYHVMRSHADQTVVPGGEEDASPIAAPLMEELAFRVRRLGIQVDQQVVIANEPDEAILRELESGQFDLIVLGGIDRGADQRLYLGHTIQSILTRTTTPAILLVSHT
jgi:nucleotide-binding universal stress UspA family protein